MAAGNQRVAQAPNLGEALSYSLPLLYHLQEPSTSPYHIDN
jgi:hypothetical protein